jgi:hypothetical protein
MNASLKNRTRNFRYKVATLIAPGLRDYLFNDYRPMDNFLKYHFKDYSLTGVEVGVWQGVHARQMLRVLNLKKLFLVDSYLPYEDLDRKVHPKEEMENNMRIAEQNIAEFTNTCWLKMSSIEATKNVPSDLDFVYIDASHAYEDVKSDINAWFPKIRNNGVLGGHDFQPLGQSVVRAAVEFAHQERLKLHFSNCDWWVVKGEKNDLLI